MTGCCAYGCSKKSGDDVKMYRFPVDPKRRGQWVTKIRSPNWKPNNNSRLCGRHFAPDQFRETLKGKRRLVPSAMPSEFCCTYPRKGKRIFHKSCDTRKLVPDRGPVKAIRHDHNYSQATTELSGSVGDSLSKENIPLVVAGAAGAGSGSPTMNQRPEVDETLTLERMLSQEEVPRPAITYDVQTCNNRCLQQISHLKKQVVRLKKEIGTTRMRLAKSNAEKAKLAKCLKATTQRNKSNVTIQTGKLIEKPKIGPLGSWRKSERRGGGSGITLSRQVE